MQSVDQAVVAMSRAHESGDVAAVRDLLAAWPDLERLAPDSTWLHRAAAAGQAGVIDFWLDRGWDVNHNLYETPKVDGVATPLHYAKDAATTRHLLSRGAAVNAWTRYGGTPLHFAVVGAVEASQRGRRRPTPHSVADQLRALLQAGADAAVADFEGLTPLALAVSLGRKTAEAALRAAGAPEKGRRPPRQPTRPPRIDLRKDAGRLATAVKKATAWFAREHPDLPVAGLYLAVSAVEGFVMIAFDTGEAGNPWDASHSDYATVPFPRWRDAYDLAGTAVTGIDGAEWSWRGPIGDTQFEKPFFDACVAALREAERQGTFAGLARRRPLAVGVEATAGEHGAAWQVGRAGGGGAARSC